MPKSGAISGTFIGNIGQDNRVEGGTSSSSSQAAGKQTFRTLCQITLRNFKITFLSSSKRTTLIWISKLFCEAALNSRSFSRWNEELKTEAISTLLGRTQGMYEHSTSLLYLSLTWPRFRLMALQLAELKRVSMTSAAKIRQVIQNLPSTLDAFSERSLLYIDSFQSEQAHTLLQWITFSPQPLTH